jgi:hypothetical protein
MFKWLATLAMFTAVLAFGQDAKQSPSAQVDQQRAPAVSEPNRPGVSVDKFPVVSVKRDWVDKTALLFSLFALLFTLALVIIGSLGIRSANETLRTIELQVVEMRAQTGVSQKMAEAARVNAEALINSERSLILVSHNAPLGSDTWDFKFKATNYGRSPAEIRWIFFEATPLDRDDTLGEWPSYVGTEDRMFMHREWVPPQGSIPVGDYSTQAITSMAGGGLWQELQSGRKKLWLYGVIRYRDKVSSEVHETRFCYWKSPAQYVGLLMGGPSGYNDVD